MVPQEKRGRRAALFLIALVLSVVGLGAALGGRTAGASRPSRDDEVVQRVPSRAADPLIGQMAALATRLTREPRDRAAAVALSRLAIEEGRRRADPRFLARAQAALAPWWSEETPPPDVLLLRATIEQARHAFDDALRDLDRLVTLAPDDPQGHLTRAVVLTVRGRFAEARPSCDALAALASPLAVAVCRAPIDAATGRAAEATAAIEAALAGAEPAQAPADIAWGHSVLGEILYWRGEDDAASRHLARALALDAGDGYTRAVHADLLLDNARPADAARLLAGLEHDDALLLRLAIAEKRLGSRRAVALAAELRGRFEAERRRGDAVHVREEARFALAIDGDGPRALTLARANWQVQREPWDARLLLEAARATGTVEDAATAFVAERGDGWAGALR